MPQRLRPVVSGLLEAPDSRWVTNVQGEHGLKEGYSSAVGYPMYHTSTGIHLDLLPRVVVNLGVDETRFILTPRRVTLMRAFAVPRALAPFVAANCLQGSDAFIKALTPSGVPGEFHGRLLQEPGCQRCPLLLPCLQRNREADWPTLAPEFLPLEMLLP